MKIRFVRIFTAVVLCAVILVGCSLPAFAAVKYALGDIDMDGCTGPDDARRALRMAVSLDTYTVAEKKLADADGNGILSPSDARLILRNAVGFGDISGKTVSINKSDKTTEATSVIPLPEASKTPGTFTVTVYGYGHGVGMSQYGAVDMDSRGFSYKKILSHYYKGTVTGKDPTYKEKVDYCGESVDTEQLVARIVYSEIYGITDNGRYAEACKAQAVAVYTLIKYYGYAVSSAGSVGYASSYSYDELPSALKDAVKSVKGRYMYLKNDGDKRPILSVYSAAAAGKTCACKDLWGGELSYLTPADSFSDLETAVGITTYEVPLETMRSWILEYSPDVKLQKDPSKWIKIISHSGSIDSSRGYITDVKVGDKHFSGTQFCSGILPSYRAGTTCCYVQYTP